MPLFIDSFRVLCPLHNSCTIMRHFFGFLNNKNHSTCLYLLIVSAFCALFCALFCAHFIIRLITKLPLTSSIRSNTFYNLAFS